MKYTGLLLLIGFVILIGPGSSRVLADDDLSGAEQQAMADTLQYALENNPTNQAADWVNPDTDRSGGVVPTRTFMNIHGQNCREFLSTIIIGGKEEQGYGTACRQVDGSWQLVSDNSQSIAPPPQAVNKTYFVTPPPVYYAYPPGFFGRSHIYLSFNHVYRSGNIHRGKYYLDGQTFRYRYPHKVRERVYIGPRIITRSRLHHEWKYRDWERRQKQHDKLERKKYRKAKRKIEKRSGKRDGRYDD